MFKNIINKFDKFFNRKKKFKLYRGQECNNFTYYPNNKEKSHKELIRAVELYKDLTEPGRIKRKERLKKINKLLNKNGYK